LCPEFMNVIYEEDELYVRQSGGIDDLQYTLCLMKSS